MTAQSVPVLARIKLRSVPASAVEVCGLPHKAHRGPHAWVRPRNEADKLSLAIGCGMTRAAVTT